MLHRWILPGMAVAGLLGGAAWAQADKPKSIKDVMNGAHKGNDSLVKKVNGGKGSADDHKKLLEYWEYLATQKPPKGDEKSWKDKTEALVAAAKDLVDKKDGALEKVKTASTCKACHDVHRPAK